MRYLCSEAKLLLMTGWCRHIIVNQYNLAAWLDIADQI